MNYGFLIALGSKILPESKFKRKLAGKFEKQYLEYKKSLIDNSTEFTYCSNEEMNYTLSLLEKCISSGLEGDVIECGVYKGGSSFQIAKMMKRIGSSKKIYALDTFSGHPYDDYEDMPDKLKKKIYQSKAPPRFKGRSNDVDLAEIKNYFSKKNLDNAIFLKGLFEDSFKLISDKKFCFAHVDADAYISVKQCIEFLKDRMVPNGIILFDDYNNAGMEGCNKAVNDLLEKDSLFILKQRRAYWVKPNLNL